MEASVFFLTTRQSSICPEKIMTGPSEKTVKRLFAVSRNRCAFPKCINSLVDPTSGKVTGRICHIKGNRHGSKRYDATQSDLARHNFENLLLLCPIHHDVIDDDEIAYTVDRLNQMKSEHEGANTPDSSTELNSKQIAQLLVSVDTPQMRDGSIITTHNQMGGQAAHTIVNVGPQPRSISESAMESLAMKLHGLPAHDYEIATNHNDSDGSLLAYKITQILNAANWNCLSNASAMFPFPMFGIKVSYPVSTPSIVAFVQGLRRFGFRVEDTVIPALKEVHIIVGYRDNVG